MVFTFEEMKVVINSRGWACGYYCPICREGQLMYGEGARTATCTCGAEFIINDKIGFIVKE